MNNPRSISGLIDSALADIVTSAVPVLKRHRKLVSEMFDEKMDLKLTHADALRCMFIPQTETEKSLHDKIMNTPNLPERIIETSNESDFRSFLRDMLRAERNNIRDTLYEVRQTDAAEYNKILQGWAKLALPKENNVKVDVDIKERQDITLRMQEMYKYSAFSATATIESSTSKQLATVPDASASGLDAASQVGDTFGAVETEYEDFLTPQATKKTKTKTKQKKSK